MPATKYDYKIAKIEAGKATRQDIIKLLSNPVFEILAGFIVIEALQKFYVKTGTHTEKVPSWTLPNGVVIAERTVTLPGQPLMPALAGTIAEAGILTAVTAQQLAPLAPYIAQGVTDVTKMLGTNLAPLALAAIPK